MAQTSPSLSITNLQVYFNHSAEVIVGAQASISLLNRNIGDVLEDHTTIRCAMGDIMNNLVSHGSVLDNLDLDSLMKEAREAHLLTVDIKNMWMMLWNIQRKCLKKLYRSLRL